MIIIRKECWCRKVVTNVFNNTTRTVSCDLLEDNDTNEAILSCEGKHVSTEQRWNNFKIPFFVFSCLRSYISILSLKIGKYARVVSIYGGSGREKNDLLCDLTHSLDWLNKFSCKYLLYQGDWSKKNKDDLTWEFYEWGGLEC